MVARCRTAVIVGVHARIVDVEADISSGLPGLTIVGLADTAVSEARDRVRAAIEHSGLQWPRTRVTVALLPASLPKRGSALDAAIAVAILAASQQVPYEIAANTCVLGELGLDGRIHAVPGAIAAALALRDGSSSSSPTPSRVGGRLLVPVSTVGEARLVPGVDAGGVRDLAHLVGVLRGEMPPERGSEAAAPPEPAIGDLADVRGQAEARRALEVAAAGGHHLAMIGVPGVGKTLLAERLPGLMPPLDDVTALEVTAIRSAAGLDPRGLVRRVPFEAPHHSASMTAIVGGGQAGRLRIGAATLAHRGVLFLDEAPEFARSVLDALRQPLESGEVRIARADISGILPARFSLVMAANPCPCGKGMGTDASCACPAVQRRRYTAKMSGPIVDRIDLRVELERPSLAQIGEPGEATAVVAERVAHARARSAARWAAEGVPWRVNADAPGSILRQRHGPDEAGARLLRAAFQNGALSMRGSDRVLRVAWTLADLDGASRPGGDHIAGAMVLRGGGVAWAA